MVVPRRMPSITTLALIMVAIGCTHTVTIRSEPPGASVFALDARGNRGAVLGATPYNYVPDRNRDYVAVELRKEGFEGQTLVVPLIEAQGMSLGVKLKKLDESWFRERFRKEQARVLSGQFLELLKLQNAILQREDNEVLRLEQVMKESFAEVSAWHSMLGNFHFLRGDRQRAIAYYRRALELDPENIEAKNMAALLRKQGG